MTGKLNRWIDITSGFGVPGENDNGKIVVDFCAEGDCEWIIHIT